MSKGFTLIELIVTIAIVAILSGVIMFSVSQYINKGKDSNIAGSLAILVPAGEAYYTGNNNSYTDFCNPGKNSVVKNVISQMPINPSAIPSKGYCYGGTIDDPTTWTYNSNPAGVCCYAGSQAWAACAREFADSTKIYCVDSRGVKKEIVGTCTSLRIGPNLKCP